MKKKFFFFLLTALIGCTPSLKMANSKYTKNMVKGRAVALFPATDSQITITYANPIKNIYQPDPRDLKTIVRDSCFPVMAQELAKHLHTAKYMNTDTQSFWSDSQRTSESYFAVTYPVGKDRQNISFRVPRKERINPSIDFAIIINLLLLYPNEKDIGYELTEHLPQPLQGTVISSYVLSINNYATQLNAVVQFIIWDYTANQPVAYGKTYSFVNSIKIGQEDFSKLYKKIIQDIVRDTPFEIISYQHSQGTGRGK